MPPQETTTLKSQYADKVTADLELNTAEQERIRDEIASLQERLTALEQDQELLIGMRAALGDTLAVVPGPRADKKTPTSASAKGRKTAASATTATAAKKAPDKASADKPAAKKATVKKATPAKATPAKATPAKATPAKATPAKATPAKATPAKATPAKATPAKGIPAKATAEKADTSGETRAPLTGLIHQHLSAQKEPKTAGEITQALAAAHPERLLNGNLVRTTTERLVARALVERSKQGSTVYYTAVPAKGTAGETPAGTEVPAQTEKAPAAATA
ncbi:hypothetical protein [Streptomyces sp. MJM1172]|uniref:hypothetical protein n=1 Tax=Streptomyces sp. MJM1172 TaxID=1703926 RepID=UPI00093E4C44|nr:hypothetical protein [Streptomyces sp. MJM1172]OKI52969.1 hypothetical protein AMK15_29325 [Streptomyces sp. MJM1172]